jgi:hypothetical protein
VTGPYTVTAAKDGYSSATVNVQVYPDRVSTANLSLAAVNSVPAVPNLVAPASGSSGIPVKPTFNWNPASGASVYCLQVSKDTTFTQLVQAGSSQVNFYTCQSALGESTTYYWRVNAVNDHGISAWSAAWPFTTGAATAGNSPPSRPTVPVGPGSAYRGQNLYFSTVCSDPDQDQMYTRFDWGDGTPLVWSMYPYYGGSFNDDHVYTTLGTYRIKAQAMDIKGSIGPWSESCSLVVANQAPGAPSYSSPNNGSGIYYTYCTFQWSCSDPDSPYDTLYCDLRVDTLNPPVSAVATGLTASYSYFSYTHYGMLPSRVYYWKIVARDGSNATSEGPVWSFTTGTKR